MNLEDHDDEMETTAPASYDSGSRVKTPSYTEHTKQSKNNKIKPKYRECLKNHAVGVGGHALDGCGEFLPAAADALKCAACSCHRNFHRKEAEPPPPPPFLTMSPNHFYRAPPPGYLHVAAQQRLLALPCTSGGGGGEEEDGGGGGMGRKRFRTKFTQEQKDGMVELAERLGWRIQKHDEAVVEQFCNDAGVKRRVFKVWMHNNKHTIGMKP